MALGGLNRPRQKRTVSAIQGYARPTLRLFVDVSLLCNKGPTSKSVPVQQFLWFVWKSSKCIPKQRVFTSFLNAQLFDD